MKMYKTSRWNDDIVEKEFNRATDKKLYYIGGSGKEYGEMKISAHWQWHETREAAIEHLKNRYLQRIESANAMIIQANVNLKKLEKL